MFVHYTWRSDVYLSPHRCLPAGIHFVNFPFGFSIALRFFWRFWGSGRHWALGFPFGVCGNLAGFSLPWVLTSGPTGLILLWVSQWGEKSTSFVAYPLKIRFFRSPDIARTSQGKKANRSNITQRADGFGHQKRQGEEGRRKCHRTPASRVSPSGFPRTLGTGEWRNGEK